MVNPRDMIVRLTVAAEGGTPIPSDVADWLVDGLHRHRYDGDSLEVALGLDRYALDAARYRFIRQGASILHVEQPKLSTWALAGVLAGYIRRFESDTWPRLRYTPEPLESQTVGDLRATLHAAFCCGRIPTTQRQIYTIIRD